MLDEVLLDSLQEWARLQCLDCVLDDACERHTQLSFQRLRRSICCRPVDLQYANDSHLGLQWNPREYQATVKRNAAPANAAEPELYWAERARLTNHGLQEMRVLSGNVRYLRTPASAGKPTRRAARKAGPEADAPLFAGATRRGGDGEVPSAEVPRLSWKPWLAAAGFAGAVVVLGTAWRLSAEVARAPVAERQDEARDAGSVAVGDSVLPARVASPHTPSAGTLIAMEVPPKPLRGQVRPNAQGRCPSKDLVIINGGCWVKLDDASADCTRTEYGFAYQGACYMPAMKLPLPATSSPPASRDGG